MMHNTQASGGARLELVHTPSCRLCNSHLLHTFVDLGMTPVGTTQFQSEIGEAPARERGISYPADQPNCQEPRSRSGAARPHPYYPLHALVCEECFLVQLREVARDDLAVHPYPSSSLASARWDPQVRAYCHMLKQRLGLGEHDLVVEVANHDDYILPHFAPLGVRVLGINRSANRRDAKNHHDFPVVSGAFGSALAARLAAEGKQASLVIANNALAEMPDLNDFLAGLKLLLAPAGLIALEFPHLARLIEETQFDTIEHNHLWYFSLATVNRLTNRHGLKIIDVDSLRSRGGSLRVYLAPSCSSRPPSPRIAKFLEQERAAGLANIETYANFAEQVQRTKRNILSFLISAKDKGKHICGYGAANKASTLLNYCGIDVDILDFAVDHNHCIYDGFIPGTHIPIKAVKTIDEAKPDYILLLHRYLKNDVAQQQLRRVNGWGGRFIVPTPEISIVEPIRIVS